MSDNLVHEGEVLFPDTESEELNRTRQVDAVETGQPYYTVDPQLNPILAGYTKLVDYDSGAAKGLIFIDAEDGKQYSLGNPSRKKTHHRIVHHHEMLQPIHNAGFELANLVHTRGGSSCFALFRHPDIIFPDTTSWDEENYYGYSGRGDDNLLHLSVAAWVSPNIGKSIRAAVGFFRSVCQNGLVSAILGLGHMRITHNQFTNIKAQDFATNSLTSLDNYELQTFSPKVLEYPLQLLDAYQRDEEQTIAQLPEFAKGPFMSAFGNQPNWYKDESAYQLNMALQSKNDLSTLDVLNIVTNISNTAENDNLYFRLEQISEAFVRLLEVSAFRSNIEFPTGLAQNVNVNVH